MKKSIWKLLASPVVLLAALGTSGCSGDDDDDDGDEIVYVQIERLGRPAINEALISTNDYLNAFNSIPPSADLSPDAAAVVGEAVATLDAIDSLDGDDDVDPLGYVAAAFLPDVMRIDTALAISTTSQSFAAATGGALGILTGGRKLEDDVVDVYYTVLTGATTGTSVIGPIGDNVRYQGYVGNAGQPGHRLLHGASAYNSAATFPFLAEPN